MTDIVWKVIMVASIIVRGLDESVKDRLAAQAREHGRSMEAEVRDILTRASARPHIGVALIQVSRAVGGVEELKIPERSGVARSVDFG
ncbi:FitA-like ribbon-helix-helix domain-containing protein [Microbacterium sp.]|uniref:FitA-like ribbon-helix-helix domain-containing protein n=1 Tax=Microbacterium sp. TaxID=51671 RepID=UPI003F9A8224